MCAWMCNVTTWDGDLVKFKRTGLNAFFNDERDEMAGSIEYCKYGTVGTLHTSHFININIIFGTGHQATPCRYYLL